MVFPERPEQDHYDNNEQVKRHFSRTPPLTKLHDKDQFHSWVEPVREALNKLVYGKHEFTKCPSYGLYWAGNQTQINQKDRDKTLLLVIEMKETEIGKWYKVDGEVRELMKHYKLSGKAGVCVRYYKYNALDTFANLQPVRAPTPSPITTRSEDVDPERSSQRNRNATLQSESRRVQEEQYRAIVEQLPLPHFAPNGALVDTVAGRSAPVTDTRVNRPFDAAAFLAGGAGRAAGNADRVDSPLDLPEIGERLEEVVEENALRSYQRELRELRENQASRRRRSEFRSRLSGNQG